MKSLLLISAIARLSDLSPALSYESYLSILHVRPVNMLHPNMHRLEACITAQLLEARCRICMEFAAVSQYMISIIISDVVNLLPA
ncbi:hypothetical protein GGR55DRAFT_307220 [Xylaria sp. FL0064]|nr:hypothetical protein GGR55DRAFT_307220 [Xylaria sp. FL0064]